MDRSEWQMSPRPVTAFYDARLSDINFPSVALQAPLFDPRMDDAPHYVNTGGTIGHELTHGFDDQGRKFDAKGNLRDWWTKEDARAFESRAKCIEDQYAKYVVVDDIHINSKLTQGEGIADLGGLLLAWMNGYIAQALSFKPPVTAIGIGMWLGLIMAFNVWFIIWPNQKKALGWSRPPPMRKPRPHVLRA